MLTRVDTRLQACALTALARRREAVATRGAGVGAIRAAHRARLLVLLDDLLGPGWREAYGTDTGTETRVTIDDITFTLAGKIHTVGAAETASLQATIHTPHPGEGVTHPVRTLADVGALVRRARMP